MTDVFSRAKRSSVMARIRATGNRDTELVCARILRRFHVTGWRRHFSVPGRPDFAFPAAKVALFIDGCFWHGCQRHARTPRSNRGYWGPKLARNRRRDRRVGSELRERGWRVLRVWEHDLRKEGALVRRITRLLLSSPPKCPTRH